MKIEKHLFLEEKWKELKGSWQWKNRRERANTSFSLKYDEQSIFIHNPDVFSMFDIEGTADFMQDLKEGYLEGLEALNSEEEITLRDLRSKDTREETLERLKYILFKKNFKNNSKGLLSKVRFSTPLVWSSKALFFEGYCNGLFYSINQLLKKANLTLDDLKEKEAPNYNTQELKKFTSDHYALAYILQAHATGEFIPSGERTKIEEKASKIGWSKHPNTFYKAVNRLIHRDLISNKVLEEIDEEWRDKILAIAKEKEKLEAFLQSKRL